MLVSKLPQFPDFTISASLFSNIENGEDLVKDIANIPYSLIDTTLICSVEQIYSAIYRVLVEYKFNRIKTKSINSELLLCLSQNSNITQNFKKFGINANTKNLVIVSILENQINNDLNKEFNALLKGEEIELNNENLQKICDMKAIRKILTSNLMMIQILPRPLSMLFS
ncbi:hypothetical protein TBLA_0C01940 [Henningerozyma blattae CBS 6284]|uniref:EKC/KEOPS complex subunit CGI121 n=1 Tax=Henningerozyma blattae (strain ATCC 34711 / CBS 6284 / DSM 70876 / NBRC 10599 / NRRL Y-10934 / UCD 77-7) TaxID=1071380 RepID=I2H0V5_HENB6|nr:hypothetical protein TBLA_0C01940 [Tetrapisispora blattae CBS 6284]CCH60007.1 hypothetical protein TBLA_0C01940 [Tetrapisispora blattae CBS 6284]